MASRTTGQTFVERSLTAMANSDPRSRFCRLKTCGSSHGFEPEGALTRRFDATVAQGCFHLIYL